MKIAIVVNEPLNLEPTHTTALLAEAAVSRGHDVYCFGVQDFIYTAKGTIEARCHILTADILARESRRLLKRSETLSRQQICLDECDVLLLRFNPAAVKNAPFLEGHLAETVFSFARFLEGKGVLVLNSPEGLAKAANKLYLGYFQEQYRPQTVVSQSPQVLLDFVASRGGKPCVMKPLKGSQGQDVFVIRPERCDNLNQIVDVLTRRGYAIAQEFLPEAASGDVRLIVVDGALLYMDGQFAAVHRVPGDGDFRSNIHTGGEARSIVATEQMQALVSDIGQQLADDGIFMAGLDFIGGKLVEINVYSIGGLHDAEQFYGVPFRQEIIKRLEQRVASQ